MVKPIKLEVGKTYITQAGYLVKFTNKDSSYFYADKKHCPGVNFSQQAVGSLSRKYGWAWRHDGSIGLDKEWSEKLKIIKEVPFDIPECPEGYIWACGYPQIVTPNIGDYVLCDIKDDRLGLVLYKTDECLSEFISRGNKCNCIALEKITTTTDNEGKKQLIEEKPTWRILGPDEIVQSGDYYSSKINKGSDSLQEFINNSCGGWIKLFDLDHLVGEKAESKPFYFKRLINSDSTEPVESLHTQEKEVKLKEVVSPEGYRQLLPDEPIKKHDAYSTKHQYNGSIESCCTVNYPHIFLGPPSYPRYKNLLFFRPLSKEQTMKSLVSRSFNYFVKEPAVTLGTPIVKSFRYVLFVGMLTSLGFVATNPVATKNAVSKFIPKVTIEMPK